MSSTNKPRSTKASAASLIAKARARKKGGEPSSIPIAHSAARPVPVPKLSPSAAERDNTEIDSTKSLLASKSPAGPLALELGSPGSTDGSVVSPSASRESPAAKTDGADKAGGKSRGRSLLQSALAKKRGMGKPQTLTRESSSFDDLPSRAAAEGKGVVEVAGMGKITQASSAIDLENMLELCDESDALELEDKAPPSVAAMASIDQYVGGAATPPQPSKPTKKASDLAPSPPRQSVFSRLASLSDAPTESCVHVSMTDYTNPLLELAPLPVKNPCRLLSMPTVAFSESAKEIFSDAMVDVEMIVKNLQGLVKSGAPENFQVLFSRAAKLIHNARSEGVVQNMFVESGVCKLLVSLISSRMSERPVISSALDFIYDICTDKQTEGLSYIKSSVASFLAAGINRVLVDILEKYSVHETICEHAMDVLSLLVISAENREVVGSASACGVCCTVLRENMTSYSLVKKTCVVLMCLAQDRPNADRLIAANAMDVLLRITSSCGDSSEAFAIWSAAFAAVSDLAYHGGEESQNKLLLSHFIASYLNMLSKLKLNSAEHTESLCIMIYSFCRLYSIPEFKERFKHENMCHTMHSFVAKHIEDVLVVSNGCLGLAVLFYHDPAESISLSDGFCGFYTKLLKKYRNSGVEPFVICCIYELLVKRPENALCFHQEKLTPELVSALVHAVDLERDLSTRRCNRELVIETTLYSTNLCATFYAMAAHSDVIRREMVDKINACSCFVAFLTLIHGRGATGSDETIEDTLAGATESLDTSWFDRNNDLLFSSCLSCIAVLYLPKVYSVQELLDGSSRSDTTGAGAHGKDGPDYKVRAHMLLSESNYLSIMTILPHFWSQLTTEDMALKGRDSTAIAGLELHQRRIEMLCWVMYHLSVACPPDRMYTIREKCIGLIRHAHAFANSYMNANTSWRCVVPFSYLLLSCCVDTELSEELINSKIFRTFSDSYMRHMENPDALCAILYVMSELLVKYEVFRDMFFEMFSSTTFLKDIVESMRKYCENPVLTYNGCMLLSRIMSIENTMIFPLSAQLTEHKIDLGEIIAAGIEQFVDYPEVILSFFHLIYCICPEYSVALGSSNVPEVMSRFFAKGFHNRRLAIYSCLAISGLCITTIASDQPGEIRRSTKLDANEVNQGIFFGAYTCVYVASIFSDYPHDNRVLEAAAIAIIHLTKNRKRIRLESENPADKDQEKESPALSAAKFVDLGCVDTLLEILKSDSISTELLVRVCGALRALCLADFETTLIRLDSLNSCEIFVSLLNTYSSNAPALSAICEISQCLAKIAVHSHTLQSFGIRQTLNVAAVVNGNDPITLKAVIGLLVALIRSDPARSQLDATDCNIFVAALQRHSSFAPLVALAGLGVSCIAKVAHRDEVLQDALKVMSTCDVVVDCLQLCLDMTKKKGEKQLVSMERKLFEVHSASVDSIEGVSDEMEFIFDPTENLADAVSGLCAACGELAAGEMYDNRLRLQSKSVVSTISQLVAAFAVVRRTSKAPIGSFSLIGDDAANFSNLRISSRCSENLCLAVEKLSLLDTMRDSFIVAGMCEDILDILLRHLEGENITNAALCALRQLVVSQQGNVGSIRLISQKACVVVHKALLRHISSARNVISTLWLMKLLSLVATGREDFAELMLIDSVLLAMDTHSDNVLVIAQALGLYRNLGLYDSKKNLDQLCREECCASIITSLKMFPEDHDIAEAACAAVQMICKCSASVKEYLIGKGMCGLLANCAAGVCPNVTSVVHCLQSIRELCSCTDLVDFIVTELVNSNIHASISVLMFKYVESMEVAEQLCYLQLILLRLDAEKHAGLFSEVNGYSEYLTSLLLRYVSSEKVSVYGCEVVLLLCSGSVAMSQLAHDGAPAGLISALQQHEGNRDICKIVCQCICAFCKNSADNTMNLSLRGVCEVTVQMLKRYEESEDVIEDVLASILVVSEESDVCKRRFFDYATGDILLKLLEFHVSSVSIVTLCCKLLISMTSNPDDCIVPGTELRGLGITFKLDSIISMHIHDADLCELCCVAMNGLLVEEMKDVAIDPETYKGLLPNAISLRNVLNGHTNNPNTVIVCCTGISLLATRGKELISELGNLSICEAVLKAWKMHSDLDDVALSTTRTVEKLAAVDSNRSRLASHDFYGLAISCVTMRGKFETNPSLLAQLLFSVNETTRGHADNADVFLGGGFFEVVATNLGFQKNITILRAACDNIVTITELKPELAMLFGNSGACGYVTRIVHHLSGLKDDPEIKLLCASVLRAARSLCSHEENLIVLRNANVFGALDSVLSTFSDNMDAGIWSCRILQKFLNRAADDFVGTQGILGSLKICQKILFCAIDRNHRDTVGLADLFSTLSDLAWKHTANIEQLLGVDAIHHVIAMVHNSGFDNVTKLSAVNTDIMATTTCCELLGTLCFVSGSRDKIRDAQGCNFLVNSLCYTVSKRHIECTVTVLRSVVAVITSNEANRDIFAKSDVIAALVTCLDGWLEAPLNEELALVAMNLICNCKSYNDNVDVATKAKEGQYNMTAVSSFRLAGAFEATFNCMSRNLEHYDVLRECCWAINSFASDKDCVTRLGSSGACASIVSVLARYGSKKLPLLQSCCNAIAALCEATSNAVTLCVAVVFESLNSYLQDLWLAYEDRVAVNDDGQIKFFSEELDTLSAVCNAICALCRETLVARSALAELGICSGLPRLLLAIKDPSVGCSLCRSVCSIFEDIPENVVLFENANVIKVLLDILVRIINSTELYTAQNTPTYIVEVCRTILKFLTGNPVLSDKTAKMGGCHSVIEMSNRYRSNKFIMVECSGIIRLLGSTSEDNMLMFTETGAWDAAVDVLNRHGQGQYLTSGDSMVVSAGSDLLYSGNVSDSTTVGDAPESASGRTEYENSSTGFVAKELSISIKNNNWAANACSALVDALRNHMSSVTATQQNCAAIAKLAANDPENALKFVELGLLELLAGLLRKHLGLNVPILIEVLNTINALCFRTPENVQPMTQLGLCEAICIAYRRHQNDTALSLAASKAICALSINEEVTTTLGVAGACQSVCRSLQDSIASNATDLVDASCRAMTRLITDNQANQEQFTVGGACQMLASALGMYMTDVSSVLEAILWAVSVLCRYGSTVETTDMTNCSTLLELHVDSSLVYVLSCFGNAPEIMEAACTTISHLCYNESAAEGFGSLGTCKVLVDLTKSHLAAKNFPILVPTVAALANMSPVSQNVQLLLQYGILETLTGIMKTQVNFNHALPALIDRCCVCLQNLCKNSSISTQLGELGLCGPFYLLLDACQQNSDMKNDCPSLMSNIYLLSWLLMVDNKVNSEEFCGLNICKLFVERLRDSEGDPDIIHPVIGGCHAVSIVDKAAVQLVTDNICPRLVSLLRRYIKRVDILEQICGTISNTVRQDPSNCVLYDECEICDALIACMRRHIDSAEVAIIICNTIADLSTHELTCKNLGRSGACESVVEALQRFSGNDGVAYPACRAISQLALHADNVEVLCDLHAYEWVVSSLFLSVENASLITYASKALSFLHAAFRLTEQSNTRIELKKLCDVYAAILDVHQSSPFTIESACGFVKCLADDPMAREILGSCDVSSYLAKLLVAYSDDAVVAKSILKAIAGVSLKNDDNKSAFSVVNVGIAVLDTMRNHWTDPLVLESALFCITTLSFGNVVNTSTFGTNGACEIVLKAVAEYAPQNSRIAAVGCQAIFCLSKGEGNLDRFDICGGVDVVADILDRYIDNEKVVRHTCSALAALGQSNFEENEDHVVMTVSECSERVCKLISKAFEVHLLCPAVSRAIVAAIGALAESPANAKYFCSNGVCGCLIRALDNNKDVVQNCAHILDTMERLAKHPCPAVDEFANKECFTTIVYLFELYSEDVVIHSNGCNLLIHVLERRRDDISPLLLESIVRMLSKFVMEAQMICYACTLIQLICTDSVKNTEACGDVGGARHLCDSLEESLRHHSSNTDVLCGIFRAMLALCISPKLVMFFASGSNSKMLLHSLTVYINDDKIVTEICPILTALTDDNATNKIEFASIDAIKILLRALSIHKSEPSASSDICASIFSLCDKNRDNCTKLINLKGGEILLELSSLHNTSISVCSSTFSVLGDVVMLQRNMLDNFKKCNIRQHVVSMLAAHPSDSKFVYCAMRLLRIIYQIETQENATLLDILDGECRIFVQALNTHAKDLDLCYEICGAISFLGLNDSCALDLGRKGACVAIRMRIADATAAVNTKLLQSALLCVTVLCKNSDEIRDQFCDAEICKTLMKALSIPEDKGIIEKLIMNSIPAICGSGEDPAILKRRVERMLDAGACENTCMVLEKRLAEANLVVAPCGAIACLTKYPPARDAFVRLGAAKFLLPALREHLSLKPIVAQFACTALRYMCGSTEGHKDVCGASESLLTISKVLEKGPSNTPLAIEICKLVSILSSGHTDIGVTFFTLGGCQSLIRILSTEESTVESLTECINAMCAVCTQNSVVLECFISAGCPKKVLELAKKHVKSQSFSKSALAALVIFGSAHGESEKLEDIFGADVVGWCVDVCDTHLESPNICLLVCNLHGVFARGGISIVEKICAHAVQIIVNFVDDDEIATAASEAIVHLSAAGVKPKEWLLSAGADAASINMLQKEATTPDIAVQICNLVQFMASETKTNVLISEAGACERVAVIFDSFSNNPRVVKNACKAIVHLVENDAENEIRLEIFEICKLLMSTFRKYLNGTSSNLSVCSEICAAIEVMAAGSIVNLGKFTLDSGLMNLLVNFLSRRFAESGDCTSCCRAIAVLAQDAKNSEIFGKVGLCESLTVVLCKNKQNVTYSYYILSAIHALCASSTANIAAVASKKFFDALIVILTDNSTQSVIDDHLTLISMKILCFMASIPSTRDVLGDSGICKLLNKYVDAVVPKDDVTVEIFRFTLLAISTLSNSVTNQKIFGRIGTCEKICGVLKKHVEELPILSAALSGVANLCVENVENINLLCRCGVVKLLVDSLNTHSDNALVHELVARIVRRLGWISAKDGDLVVDALTNSALPSLLVAGLKRHIKARNVNRVICAGIRNMAILSPLLKVQLGADKVCPELCKAGALGLSVSDDELLSEAIDACTALVADSCNNQEAMGAAGLCELLADVCNEKVENDAIVEKLFYCVANMCRCGVEPITASTNNMVRFAATNFCDNVVQVIQTNISSLEAVRMAYVAARNLCANEQNLSRIVGIGGCEAICITLKRLLHNEKVCEAACGTLAVLSTRDCYRRLVSLGAIDLITLTLQRYPNNMEIVSTASTGVINLCRDYDNKRQFAQKGVCGIISRVLLKLGHHSTVAVETCAAVQSLSENCPENKILLGAAGACEAIVTALKAHPGNLVVGKAATGALNSLIEGNGTNAKRISDAGGDKLRVSSLSTVEWRIAPGEAVTE